MDEMIPLLTTTDGRIARRQWWMGLLVLVVASILVSIVLAIVTGGNPTAVAWGTFLLNLVLIWPTYCIGLKRRHDRDNDGRDLMVLIGASVVLNLLQALGIGVTPLEAEGVSLMVPDMWLAILQVIVFAFAIYMLVQLGFMKGTDGPNSYGPDPLAG